MLHSAAQKIHRLENWVYADATARTTAAGFITADIGKIAFQTDTSTYWRLTAITPTWAALTTGGPTGATGPAGVTGATGPTGAGGGGGGLGSRVSNSTNITVNTATLTVLTFDTEEFVDDTQHETITNPSRLTCHTTGRYLIIGNVGFQTNATGKRQLVIKNNSGTIIGQVAVQAVTTSALTYVEVSTIADLTSGDYVELYAYQDSGSSLTASALSGAPVFMMMKV